MSKQAAFKPKEILGVAAHPDDMEFGAAGSIAKWINDGASVHYLICSDGSKGAQDTNISGSELTKIRRAEQEAAAEALGIKGVSFLDYEDAKLECSLDLKRDITRAIRQLKPDTLVTFDPTFVYSSELGFVNHTDHRAVGMAALDAAYPLARDHLSLPELTKEGLKPHKVSTLLLMNMEKSNYYVDITGTFDTKLKALKAHRSQLPDMKAVSELLRRQAVNMGKQNNCQLAEGFVKLDLPA